MSQQESLSSQGDDQLSQAASGGGIYAEHIAATNVVSGMQIIEQQILHLPGQKPASPLQRPPLVEHFTDREQERTWLLDNLKPGRIVTLCGPGGMGKTALVSNVLWELAPGDIPPDLFPDGILFHSFYRQPEVKIALEQIALTFGEDPRPTPALAAQRALSRRHALLIFDGAEEADHLRQALEACAGNAVLITSRRRSDAGDPRYLRDLHPLPEAHAVAVVQAWGEEQATNEATIRQICQLVGNLPLALRLAGRYLALQQEEAEEYLRWLQESPLAALDQGASQHTSVPVLLERSVSRLSANAQQVLTVLGLLVLAPVRREWIAQVLDLSSGAASRALGDLVNYGLLRRLDTLYDLSHPLIHTYAHEVLLAREERDRQQTLAERVVLMLAERFPEVTAENRGICEELLPHVQTCAALVGPGQVISPEAASLLARAGDYLYQQIRYEEAELLYQGALMIYEQQLGPLHPDTAGCLNNLAGLYHNQGKYEQAEPLYQRALAIYEQQLGPQHPNTANSLNNLAGLYVHQGKYEQAEPLYQRALAIREQQLGPQRSDTANSLNGLAALYQVQGKYEQAEPLYRRALAIYEQQLGHSHPDTAGSLNNLAALYDSQGKYEQAELLYQRALSIYEQQLGPLHPNTATGLNNLAQLYAIQGKYEQAEPLYQRALVIREQQLGPLHPDTAQSLNNLAGLYKEQGKYEQAELLYQRALAIREQQLGPLHPDTANSLNNLAELYREQGKYEQAKLLYQRALAICEQQLGPLHPDTAHNLNNLAALYANQDKYEQAEPLYQRALAIREQQLGPLHPDTASSLNNLAGLYTNQDKYEQAEPLYQRALAFCVQQLGPSHSMTATIRKNYASLLRMMQREDKDM